MNVKSIVKNMTLNENIADVSWLVQIVAHDDVKASHVVWVLLWYPVWKSPQTFQHDYTLMAILIQSDMQKFNSCRLD